MIYTIGVNRPAIVREIPHFGLFPAFQHFSRTSRISGFISKLQKSLEIAIIFAVRRHFVRKSSAKTAMIASPAMLFLLKIRQQSLNIAIIVTVGYILFEKALRKV